MCVFFTDVRDFTNFCHTVKMYTLCFISLFYNDMVNSLEFLCSLTFECFVNRVSPKQHRSNLRVVSLVYFSQMEAAVRYIDLYIFLICTSCMTFILGTENK